MLSFSSALSIEQNRETARETAYRRHTESRRFNLNGASGLRPFIRRTDAEIEADAQAAMIDEALFREEPEGRLLAAIQAGQNALEMIRAARSRGFSERANIDHAWGQATDAGAAVNEIVKALAEIQGDA